jgi:hypothetical protein
MDEINPNGFFRGYFHVPDQDDSKSSLSGRIVEEFSEFELEKWAFIEGFGTDIGGTAPGSASKEIA